jgi:hypothetical protein
MLPIPGKSNCNSVSGIQGDHIGRIFAGLGGFFSITETAQIFRLLFKYILSKNGMGYFLGDFFTNLSGHPGGIHTTERYDKTFIRFN